MSALRAYETPNNPIHNRNAVNLGCLAQTDFPWRFTQQPY